MLVMLTVVSNPVGAYPVEDIKLVETTHVMSDNAFGETYDVMEGDDCQRQTLQEFMGLVPDCFEYLEGAGMQETYSGYFRAKKSYEYLEGVIKVEIGNFTCYAESEGFIALSQDLYKSGKGSLSCIGLATLVSLLKPIEELFKEITMSDGFCTWLEENR